jgi:hypothetical protein
MYFIKSLYIYPIKGLKRISVEKSYVEAEGLQYDRRWLIIDKTEHKFLSQRSHPTMALFQVKINDDGFIQINYNNDSIKFHTSEYLDKPFYNASVWGDSVKSVEISKSVSDWLSHHLGTECMLVKKATDGKREKFIKTTQTTTLMSYADGYPILIIGTASMELLNEKCSIYISDERFRPNIIIETNTPHEEDNTMQLIINDDVILKTVKPCVRCQVPQIDPSTAVFGKEPLKTLSTYRRINNEIIFGSNAIVLEEGMIKVGQRIAVN